MTVTPFLVPALVTLRAEFNQISPNRDKGADGWIGDAAHQARTSDHNPRPDGRVLALDIDSSGPWPGKSGDLIWFTQAVFGIVRRERQAWLDPARTCRLEYVIFNGAIASCNTNFLWVDYNGSDPHINHAHFSARHDGAGNTSTAPWGLLPEPEEDTMAVQDVRDYFASAAAAVRGVPGATARNRQDRDDLAAVIRFAFGLNWAQQDGDHMPAAVLLQIERDTSALADWALSQDKPNPA